MNQIEIEGLCKRFGAYEVLSDITVSIPEGAFVALIGPSGCGKSTLLRTIAGLERSSAGSIRIAGESMEGRPPRQRDVAMVFQSYALYPHMDVEANMNYSLRLRKRPKAEITTATGAAASTLGLDTLLARFPRELSGGQRQRVAMGRAIVRNPKVFLFDEPLSNLDAALRVHMRHEIRRLHDRLGATSVYVTHDQIEAMTMADHIVVLRAGRVEQQGRPLELYDRPANRFVAGFIGSPAMNFLPGRIGPDGTSLLLAADERSRLQLARALAPGREVIVGLRPEHLVLGGSDDTGSLTATVEGIDSTGSMTFVYLSLGEASLIVTSTQRLDMPRQAAVRLSIEAHNIHLFDPHSEQAI